MHIYIYIYIYISYIHIYICPPAARECAQAPALVAPRVLREIHKTSALQSYRVFLEARLCVKVI